MRFRFAIAFLPSLMFGPALAEEVVVVDTRPDADCAYTPESEDNCVRFVGCFFNDGVWFKGESRGWSGGEVTLEAADGDTCRGAFTYRSVLDMGKSTIVCRKRAELEMSFFVRDKDRNVISGTGVSPGGVRAQMWAGADLAGYFAETRDAPVTCGDVTLDIR